MTGDHRRGKGKVVLPKKPPLFNARRKTGVEEEQRCNRFALLVFTIFDWVFAP